MIQYKYKLQGVKAGLSARQRPGLSDRDFCEQLRSPEMFHLVPGHLGIMGIDSGVLCALKAPSTAREQPKTTPAKKMSARVTVSETK
ncbi:hypothetical protein OG21DRAFT_1512048 [Imleria badia]|nr:hypothetical protein OG21DRAFT_1512048 [Imleria badia]